MTDIHPTTPLGRRALAYATGPDVRARAYWSGQVDTAETADACMAVRVLWSLEGCGPLSRLELQWLSLQTTSPDRERAEMAAVALGLLIDRSV